MPDPVTIVTLVTVIITAGTQLVQMYFDYKHHELEGHSSIYRPITLQSSCCSDVNTNPG